MSKPVPEKPNILWLTMDHVTFHHYRNLGGALPVLSTYEELCEAGTEFTNCKSTHPLCLPCRASMLTGLYTHKHQKYRNERGIGGKDVPLISKYLHEGGYDVAYFGKNHSGFEPLGPYGFDCFESEDYGNPYLSQEYREYLSRNQIADPVYHQEWGMKGMFGKYPDGDYNLTQEDNFNTFSCGTLTPERVHEADFIIDLAKRWLEQHREKPFVLRVDTWGPHQAYQVPAEFADTIIQADEIELPPSIDSDIPGKPSFVRDFLKEEQKIMNIDSRQGWQHVLKRAYENYSYIDKRFGELIQWIKDIGLGDSTAILMTADHGDSLGTSGGMFDKCGDMPEELMNIPMVIYAPWMDGKKKVGSLTSNLDVVPTVLDLLNLPIPGYMDGVSLKAVAEGRAEERDALMCEHYGHMNNYYSQRALYQDGYKLVTTEGEPDQLYHIAADPFELEELSRRPEAQERYEAMKARLKKEQKRFQDDQPLVQKERPKESDYK